MNVIAAIDWLSIALVISAWVLATVMLITRPNPDAALFPGMNRQKLKRQGLGFLVAVFLLVAWVLTGSAS
ncbi:MAG: hypothetical protein WCO82_04295 [Sphingomonadales bacterium]|jgi:uncharacterized membrane protein